MASYLDRSLEKLEWFEGAIPWMYVDSVGKVTVGVGLMLPDTAAAQKLHFIADERPATQAEIAAEFARVHALPMGRPAQFYRRPGAPTLDKSEMDSLLRAVLIGFETELRTGLTGYDSFPDSVKLALLDMAYNLGPAGLLRGYPRLIAAVEAGDWAGAARLCFRHGPGAARNQWTAQMFLASVASSIQAVAEGPLRRFLYGMIGIGATAFERMRGR